MARNAVAAKRRKQKLKPDQLDPKIAAGITQGYSRQDVIEGKLDEIQPAQKIAPLHERVGHMREPQKSRAPRVRFVAEPNGAVVNMGDGRRLQDVAITVTPETKMEMQSGYRCLRCHERQEHAFPLACDLCGYQMRERQILDIAMEFEGTKHIGPKKPISEYLEEQDTRVEKRQFIQRILEGHNGKIPKEWLRDATLLEGLTPNERRMIGA